MPLRLARPALPRVRYRLRPNRPIRHHAARDRDHQPALSLYGPRIERQRALEQADLLRESVTRWRLFLCGASPENVVQRLGMFGRSAGLGPDQLQVERNRDPARDLVLQREQIACVAIEPVGPKVRVALGIDQLGIDADLAAGPTDASFQDIAHTQLAANLPGVIGLFR